MKNILSIFKRFFSYKWSPNFISTIFKNEKMETISDDGFNKIDYGCLTLSNSFFVKLCCAVIIIIFANISLVDIKGFNLVVEVLKQNFFVPVLYLLIGIVPSFIIYTTKKNRYVKRYPRLYYNMLIIVLISLIEVIFSTIYFISSFGSSKVLIIASIIGLIANIATFIGHLSISVGIIDFCIFTNRVALDKKVSAKTDFGDYVDYF